MSQTEIFPKELFVPPLRDPNGRPLWKFEEEPINAKLLKHEAQDSDALRKALNKDLTGDFIRSLHFKVTRHPAENINVEIKGETRSGKSTVGIFLGKLISYWHGHDFTVDNILANQGEVCEKLKKAKFGETFLVDETTANCYGEGINRESDQLDTNLDICAKECNNLIFIFPPKFVARNAPYGLETLAKDTHNKYVRCFFHDLRRKQFGYGGIWPQGYIQLPKYVEEKYQKMPRAKWSAIRTENWEKRGYDYDSQLEENYEIKKSGWIAEVREMQTSTRMKTKEEIAEILADDDKFLSLKTTGQREAYILLKINHGEITDMARTEVKTIADMASVIAME